MAPLLAEMKLKAASGIPADDVQNSFAIDLEGDPDGADAGQILADLVAFYTTAVGGPHSLAYYIADTVSRVANTCEFSLYDLTGALDGSPHGSPIFTGNWTLTASGGAEAMASEVAAVLTLQAAGMAGVPEDGPVTADIPTPRSAQNMGAPDVHVGTTRPRARRRGRVYLGPLNLDATEGTPIATAAFISQDLINTAVNVLQDLQAALLANTKAGHLSVWSRRGATLNYLDETGGRIGWMENAFDIQRRRGVKQTAKTFITS